MIRAVYALLAGACYAVEVWLPKPRAQHEDGVHKRDCPACQWYEPWRSWRERWAVRAREERRDG